MPEFVLINLVAIADGLVRREFPRLLLGQALRAAPTGAHLGDLPGAALPPQPERRRAAVRDPFRPERGGDSEHVQEVPV